MESNHLAIAVAAYSCGERARIKIAALCVGERACRVSWRAAAELFVRLVDELLAMSVDPDATRERFISVVRREVRRCCPSLAAGVERDLRRYHGV